MKGSVLPNKLGYPSTCTVKKVKKYKSQNSIHKMYTILTKLKSEILLHVEKNTRKPPKKGGGTLL